MTSLALACSAAGPGREADGAGAGGNSNSTGGAGAMTGTGGAVNGSGGTTTGIGGTTNGTGGLGTGGSVTGTGGLVGTGGTGGTDDTGDPPTEPPPPDVTCGKDVTPIGIGRCATGLETGLGTALTIHDFEEPGENSDYLGVFFADNRTGTWSETHDTVNGATASLAVETTTAPPDFPSSTRALHYHGTAPGGYGATAMTVLADCYDATAYEGISFYIKGNQAAGNQWIKFSVHTPVSEPEPSGGCSAADELAGKCRDHFHKVIPLTSGWVRHSIKWSDLVQNCPSNIEQNYNPGSQIVTLSFSITDFDKGYDFWIDNVSFDVGTEPASGFSNIVSEETFKELWLVENAEGMVDDRRDPVYTYAGLVSAINNHGSGFCTSGDWTSNRREAAAFFGNIAHESDMLALTKETACQNGSCEYGNYYGRGPIQLTWSTNYSAAGSFLGLDLVGNPDIVATDAAVAWGTTMWFWMGSAGAGTQTPHAAIQAGSFGETIKSINGANECGGKNAPAIADRQRHYLRFCRFLGVDPGTSLGC